MRRRRSSRSRRAGEPLNVTPLIDVVMVLIIFYLMVGSFIDVDYEDVRLPLSTEGAPPTEGKVFTINVLPPDEAGGRAEIHVRGQVVTTRDLASRLEAERRRTPELSVQLRATRDLPYGAVEPVVRAVAGVGVRSLRLVTEPAR